MLQISIELPLPGSYFQLSRLSTWSMAASSRPQIRYFFGLMKSHLAASSFYHICFPSHSPGHTRSEKSFLELLAGESPRSLASLKSSKSLFHVWKRGESWTSPLPLLLAIGLTPSHTKGRKTVKAQSRGFADLFIKFLYRQGLRGCFHTR